MTVFQSWILTTVKALVGSMRQDNEPNWLSNLTPQAVEIRKKYHADWDLLELRLAIGLVQVRALECRQMAGMIGMEIDRLTERAPVALRGALAGAIRQISRDYLDRSHNLEKIGLEMAQPGKWPPDAKVSEGEPEGKMLVQ